MKKIVTLFYVLIALSACSSDVDNTVEALPDFNELILEKLYILGGTSNGNATPYTHDCPSNRDYEEFKSDGVGTYVGHNTACEVDEEDSGTYVIEGSLLKITDTGEFPLNAEYNIIKLTESELVLTRTINEPEGQIVEVANYSKI